MYYGTLEDMQAKMSSIARWFCSSYGFSIRWMAWSSVLPADDHDVRVETDKEGTMTRDEFWSSTLPRRLKSSTLF